MAKLRNPYGEERIVQVPDDVIRIDPASEDEKPRYVPKGSHEVTVPADGVLEVPDDAKRFFPDWDAVAERKPEKKAAE